MLPREYVVKSDVVGLLTLVEVEVDTLVDTDFEVLVLTLEYVEKTVVVGVLTLFEVEVDVLVLADVVTLVDLLELKDVDRDVDVDVLDLTKLI